MSKNRYFYIFSWLNDILDVTMEYITPLVLTTIITCSIIYILIKLSGGVNDSARMLDLKHRQSTIHNIVQSVLPTNEEIIQNIIKKKRKTSTNKQSRQKYNPEQIKVLVVENKAYWIQDNTFYETYITDDGEIDQASSRPVDTTNLGDEDVDRLMKIVDELRSVEKDDDGSSGN